MASAGRHRRPIVVRRGRALRATGAVALLFSSLMAIWLCWPATLNPKPWSPGSLAASPLLDGLLGRGEWRGATGGRIEFGAGAQRFAGFLRWGVRDGQLWLAVHCGVPDADSLAVHLDLVGGAIVPDTGRADGFVVVAAPGPAGAGAFQGGTVDAPARIVYPPSASSQHGRDRCWELAVPLADLGLAPGGRFLFMIEVRGPASTHLWPAEARTDQPSSWRRGRFAG